MSQKLFTASRHVQQTGMTADVDSESFSVVVKMLKEKGIVMPKEKTVEQGTATTEAAALDPKPDGKCYVQPLNAVR